MTRSEFKPATKAKAFERSGGLCETCKERLQVGKFHYDHVIPDGLGGANTLENCGVICTPCHGAKTTSRDVPQIAKMKRQKRAHIGAKPKSALAARHKQNTATRPLGKTCNRF
jgi:5-methylcytosine-specific restriction endonuclease McrA